MEDNLEVDIADIVVDQAEDSLVVDKSHLVVAEMNNRTVVVVDNIDFDKAHTFDSHIAGLVV